MTTATATNSAHVEPVVSRVSWLCDGLLGDTPCRFVLDTGAELTIAQIGLLPGTSPPSALFHMRNAGRKGGSQALHGPRLTTATLGMATVSMYVHEADTHEPCLLGGDFVAMHVKNFDVDNDTIIIEDDHGQHRVQLVRVTRPSTIAPVCLRVEVKTHTPIPGGTEVCVPVTVDGCDIIDLGVDGDRVRASLGLAWMDRRGLRVCKTPTGSG